MLFFLLSFLTLQLIPSLSLPAQDWCFSPTVQMEQMLASLAQPQKWMIKPWLFFSSERKCLELAGDAKVVAVKNTGCFCSEQAEHRHPAEHSGASVVQPRHRGILPCPSLLQVVHNSSPRPSPSLCPAQQPHLGEERNPSWQKPWLCNPGLCQLEGGSSRRESSWANGIMVQEMESDLCFLFTHPAKWE